ncbi:SIMPL domain-containing protein [Cellulomonas biazotea]|uniref:SIMPL domain-containing protein n=1 Tax=Cellulomonas biazotea TaxID=1709 RepID=A0A402DSQ4_9CELL|nr:SIMPL domain-containing protein [Cellulomonas biazotea]GCE77141.1 SIMPL domain-containing protein [Cellulomonas biazotea]
MRETTVTVEGRFDHHRPAERGTVTLTVGFEGRDREDVVRRVVAEHGRIAGDVQHLQEEPSPAVTWWSSDRVRVWSQRPWNQDGKQLPLVHHAAVEVEVKFKDLVRLALWVEDVATRDGVSVGGITWALTEATRERLTADARDRAVHDAVAKATSYAHSLGLSDVRPVAVADPGMLGDGSAPTTPAPAMQMARAGAGAGAGGALDLKPEDITVEGRVHARFAAS